VNKIAMFEIKIDMASCPALKADGILRQELRVEKDGRPWLRK